MRRRQRRKHQRHELGTTEIELLPMLNVFIAIIPLLLLSAAFVQMSIIPTLLPTSAAAAGGGQKGVAPLDLSITISDQAYVVQGNGLVTRTVPRPAAGANAGLSADPRRQLAAVLAVIVEAHPGTHDVRLVAQSTTRYEEIIDLMDIARAVGLANAALDDAARGV
jgi:biopolymer transport protein ExbD